MTLWGLLLTAISTPSVIIDYFGNEDNAKKLYKQLQVNARAYIKVRSVSTPVYINEGRVLVLKVENLSNFPAKNIKTKVYISKKQIVGSFNNKILSHPNLSIPPKTISEIAVVPLKQLYEYIQKEYPVYKIIGITLLNKHTNKSGIGEPFIVNISYKTNGGEDVNKTVALKAILSKDG